MSSFFNGINTSFIIKYSFCFIVCLLAYELNSKELMNSNSFIEDDNCAFEESFYNPCNLNVVYDAPDGFLNFYCDSFSLDVPRWTIIISEISGGSGNYSVSPYGDGIVSCPFISSGSGFTYSFTANDQQNDNIGFEITDGNGNICYMDPQILLNLTFLWSPDLFCQTISTYSYCQNYYTLKDDIVVTNLDIATKKCIIIDDVHFNNTDVNLQAGNSISILETEIFQNTNFTIEISDCIQN